MNAAHIHLMFNHLSLVGLGFTFLLLLIGMARKDRPLQQLACWFYILVAVLSVIPIVTGDGAQEILQTYPGISTESMEYHETWGYSFFYGALAVGAVALAALWFTRQKEALLAKFTRVLLVMTVVVLALAWQTGTTGGAIRHPESSQGAFRTE